MEKYSQSIFDSLFRVMPELRQSKLGKDYVDPIAAKALFNIWKKASETKKGSKVYKRPSFVSHDDLERMRKEDLVRNIGDNIELTAKGNKTIKIMILGDTSSAFDKNASEIDYEKALMNVKNVKVAKKTKTASWWDRFEK